jgi:hypothetical protein
LSFNSSKRESSRKCILFDSNRLLRIHGTAELDLPGCGDAMGRRGTGGGRFRFRFRWFPWWCLSGFLSVVSSHRVVFVL